MIPNPILYSNNENLENQKFLHFNLSDYIDEYLQIWFFIFIENWLKGKFSKSLKESFRQIFDFLLVLFFVGITFLPCFLDNQSTMPNLIEDRISALNSTVDAPFIPLANILQLFAPVGPQLHSLVQALWFFFSDTYG